MTLSKFPILFRGYIPFEAEINNFCIYSDILLPSADTVRVFNAHLASIHFKPDDYAFSQGKFESWSEFEKGASQVIDKLSLADVCRSKQIEVVMAEVAKSPYPRDVLPET